MEAAAKDTVKRKSRPLWLRYLLRGLMVLGVLFVLSVLVAVYLFRYGPYLPDFGSPSLTRSFEGDSSLLKSTQIVPTLDTPVEPGKNVIWCASFVAAWKKLQTDVASGPVMLAGGKETCDRLNAASDPANSAPDGSLYAAAGWVNKGIIDTIRAEMKGRFADDEPPEFPGIAPNSVLAFAHMEAAVPFTIPYFENREPLSFTDSSGKSTEVRSFGIREKDQYAYYQLRKQPRVLGGGSLGFGFTKTNATGVILDLCADSQPSQVIVACVEPKPTLAEMLAPLEERIQQAALQAAGDGGIGSNDVLLVPDIFWKIEHRFTEVEGRTFTGIPALASERMDMALQSIVFRLDRSGAKLRAEARVYYLPTPTYYVVDRPFLVIMQKRGAAEPYFVMWVDNAELLQKW